MTGQPTVDTSHAIVTRAARRAHWEVVDAKGKLGEGAFRLGGALAAMQESRAYTALGFATFEEYLAGEEVALHRVTAYRFIRVFRTYQHVAHGQHWGRVDLRKLDILARLIDEDTDPAQIEALVAEAQTMPREELRAAVNEEARRRGALPPEERDTPVRLVRPTPPPAPSPDPALAAGLALVGAGLAADPEFRARVLGGEFRDIAHLLHRAASELRTLCEDTPPEELAQVLDREDLARYTRDYEERIKPLLAWYEQVLALGRRGGVQRVK